MSDILDVTLAPSGEDKINWVESYMPVLRNIKKEFEKRNRFSTKK